ncbi:MAG: N-acetyltransferase [Pseudomonadota bacterium]
MAGDSIRRCGPGDEGALSLIGQATFLESFAGILPGGDILAHCEKRHSVAVYRKWLGNKDAFLWLSTVAPGRAPVGYLAMMKPDLPLASIGPKDLEIKRIYVLRRFQGRGIGRKLMQTATTRARSLGMTRLLLGVYGRNESAIEFYQKIGFTRVGERQFKLGRNTYDDLILALDLPRP